MQKPSLTIVSNDLPEPPYPADTKANGYKQEIDLYRICQSKTWILADAEIRPWLLMLWISSWGNVPTGSWDDDDAYIAARIGCKFEFFVGHREQIMRGWKKYNDGRLYHDYIKTQVVEMLRRRRSSTDRKRKSRMQAAENGHVTRDAHVTTCDPHGTYAKEQEQEQDNIPVTVPRSSEQFLVSHPEIQPDFRRRDKDAVTEDSQRGGENSAGAVRPLKAKQDRTPPCPYAKIHELWEEILPEMPTQRPDIERWTTLRKTRIHALWKTDLPTLDHWRDMLKDVRQSRFLMGKVAPRDNKKTFRVTLDWLINPTNWAKFIESRYHED